MKQKAVPTPTESRRTQLAAAAMAALAAALHGSLDAHVQTVRDILARPKSRKSPRRLTAASARSRSRASPSGPSAGAGAGAGSSPRPLSLRAFLKSLSNDELLNLLYADVWPFVQRGGRGFDPAPYLQRRIFAQLLSKFELWAAPAALKTAFLAEADRRTEADPAFRAIMGYAGPALWGLDA
jgi:hypothetical protein